MKIVYGISHWKERFSRTVLAIGVFDGLHHGHRLLIRKTIARSQAIHGTPVVLTFDPHPAQVLYPDRRIPLIAPLTYRLQLLQEQGIQACLVVRFTKRFAAMEYTRFIDYYLRRMLAVSEIVVGEDFHFGRDRRGNVRLLREAGQRYHFKVHEIPISKVHGQKKVSSTRIREFIAQGDIVHAQRLLDRPVTIMGRVIPGDRRGRSLGYPTANLDAAVTGFAPRGVYCVRVQCGDRIFFGMANVGFRPSFKTNGLPNIEVHLFDFHQDIYGRQIVVEFLKKIRDEIVFHSPQQLMKQLHQDEQHARQWFARPQ